VQNKHTRVITGTPRTPVLATQHWLPVRQWIIYKVASNTYKSCSTNSPKIAKGARAFGAAAPEFWHDLHLIHLQI